MESGKTLTLVGITSLLTKKRPKEFILREAGLNLLKMRMENSWVLAEYG